MTPGRAGTLFIVSTPIGNMGDFSFRAVSVLKDVAAVLAEDTRHSRHLLDRYDVDTPLVAYHEHNEAKSTPRLIERLQAGESLALVSDAGTPLLSDPGGRLVRAALDARIAVSAIPGASAMLAALVVSGMNLERFTFFGFLPRKGRERRAALDEIASMRHPVVVYEAPSRTAETLGDMTAAGMGDRGAMVARELTKQFEELRHGTVTELATYYHGAQPRGEIVIVIAGAAALEDVPEEVLRERAATLRVSGASPRDIASALVSELGASRNVAYRLAHE